jgi:PAS domain S-box-containing protein
MRGFSGADDARALLDVCGEHGHVLPSESYSTLGTPEDRLRAIALLQQKASALEVETARRRALEETLARRERELSHYLEHARESVLDVESGGRLRWANRAWLTRLGYERHELDHRSASDVLLSEAAVRDAWARLLRGDPLPEDTEVEFRAKDGRVVPMLVQSGMLRTVDGVLHMRWLLREPPVTGFDPLR